MSPCGTHIVHLCGEFIMQQTDFAVLLIKIYSLLNASKFLLKNTFQRFNFWSPIGSTYPFWFAQSYGLCFILWNKKPIWVLPCFCLRFTLIAHLVARNIKSIEWIIFPNGSWRHHMLHIIILFWSSSLLPSVTPHFYYCSNFRLANNNGISRVKRVTCHSATFISLFRYHFMCARYSDSKSPSVFNFFFLFPFLLHPLYFTRIFVFIFLLIWFPHTSCLLDIFESFSSAVRCPCRSGVFGIK